MEAHDKYSDAHENYSNEGTGEGTPGSIDPNDITRSSPSKSISEVEKLERNESALGINQSLKASAENLDQQVSQIDEGTRQMQRDKLEGKSMEETVEKQFDTDDSNRIDDRDQNDSTEDWNADQSRTGRQK
jgi:hypothetical protein